MSGVPLEGESQELRTYPWHHDSVAVQRCGPPVCLLIFFLSFIFWDLKRLFHHRPILVSHQGLSPPCASTGLSKQSFHGDIRTGTQRPGAQRS